ncbi:MAG: serine protease [Gammaproteobacteria bacterium]|nr:serine protease [Gammaproteobacteria bacterium]
MTQSSAARILEISSELSGLVTQAGQSVVAIGTRGGRTISGILWRPGYVVSASEAFEEEPAAVRVVSATGSEHAARLVGRDASTDVALLAVEGLSGEALPAADATMLRAGQVALALGRSPEHGPIVSLGSIAVAGAAWHSRLGGHIERFIRLDASLTPAAEGGAVVAADGRLIGMAVRGPRGALLVIPAATLERVAEPLRTRGRIARGYLGLAMQPVRLPDRLQRVANTSAGLLISGVDGQNAAAPGGALIGDVLVAVNGQPLRDYRQLQRLLGPESVGSELTFVALRGGERIELRLTVGERPASG